MLWSNLLLLLILRYELLLLLSTTSRRVSVVVVGKSWLLVVRWRHRSLAEVVGRRCRDGAEFAQVALRE